ncbi:peptidoglycan-recognition protein SC2-like [Copidosoma floridanum]|uniref:peptidoglycan-recognition protein SC2-like n=1 Tax=Copidosoma floridanum TaxID=29053 RepID=UPI0006C9463E|nr:peptidoglycan-recognition protein SC2-like [Copidosoma floridanum]
MGKRVLLFVLMLMVKQGEFWSTKTFENPKFTIITRSEWGAQPPKGNVGSLKTLPATYVVIHHAASLSCTNRAICQARIRTIQNFHMKTEKLQDIGFNFLVGEDGNVYEGRGWEKAGAHAENFNDKSIGICVIGNFDKTSPSHATLAAIKNLISHGVSQGKLNSQYILIGHRQAETLSCPGHYLYQLIQTWSHWRKISQNAA